jgi:hypothetical protein
MEPLTYLNLTNPTNQTYIPYNVPVGRINQWTLSVEHQFARDFAASIAYVGSHGMNLQYRTDINQITNPADLLVPNNQSLRPFPLWGSITGNHFNGISNYNSLQGTVQKRYSNGLTFQVNYVWSHFLDDLDSAGWGQRGGIQRWQIGNDPKSNYGNSNFDIPHAVKGIVSYELPFGHGKAYFHGNTVEDALVGGWRLSGTFLHQSGNPFTAFDGIQPSGSNSKCSSGNNANGGCVWYLNRVGDPFSNVPAGYYFNPAAFTAPNAGTFGTNGRNNLRGPRLTVVNLSLAKNVRFGERCGLELRADFVNALNHPSFQPPNSDINGAAFGQITSSETAGGTTVAPRSGQLSARFTF